MAAIAKVVDALVARFIREFEIIIKGDFESLKHSMASRLKIENNEIRSAARVFHKRWIE